MSFIAFPSSQADNRRVTSSVKDDPAFSVGSINTFFLQWTIFLHMLPMIYRSFLSFNSPHLYIILWVDVFWFFARFEPSWFDALPLSAFLLYEQRCVVISLICIIYCNFHIFVMSSWSFCWCLFSDKKNYKVASLYKQHTFRNNAVNSDDIRYWHNKNE